MTESPQFIDGLNAIFSDDRESWLEHYPDAKQFERKKVGEDLEILDSSIPGCWRFYVEHKGNQIAHLSKDHESGIHKADWIIDFSADDPLFVIGIYSFDRQNISLSMGFKSRGVDRPSGLDGVFFPERTIDYKFLGEQLQVDLLAATNPNVSQRSMTTGEEVEIVPSLRKDSIVLTSRLANGNTEEIRLLQHQVFSFGGLYN